jgi:hypothetical protein
VGDLGERITDSVDGIGSGFEAGLPDIMEAQRASTSTVAALASTRGFFSTFLHY